MKNRNALLFLLFSMALVACSASGNFEITGKNAGAFDIGDNVEEVKYNLGDYTLTPLEGYTAGGGDTESFFDLKDDGNRLMTFRFVHGKLSGIKVYSSKFVANCGGLRVGMIAQDLKDRKLKVNIEAGDDVAFYARLKAKNFLGEYTEEKGLKLCFERRTSVSGQLISNARLLAIYVGEDFRLMKKRTVVNSSGPLACVSDMCGPYCKSKEGVFIP
ncbi:hypothetical protein FUAX_51330 (plasmid) [Fulvitalea axinellae]|uniref:Lipoprotein n=1 Tax=Fulvitalea axinellae TaxID=1182444 RepID=A0AAU9DHX4_9BACT|nr:hypothetical protein FUAX_51330 [Fulvitalea axinellae]